MVLKYLRMKFSFDDKKLVSIAEKYGLKFVILHGSYATARSRPDSDIDIAVLGKRPLSFAEQLRLYGELATVFGDQPSQELDCKTLHGVDPLFRYEVTRDGRLLYGDAADYEEFKAGAYLAYEDAKPLFDLERTLMHKYQEHLNQLIVRYA